MTTGETFKPPMPLSRVARRALGVLIEKAFCSPDSYPLTLNAAVAGSNQKTARDPAMELTPEQVEEGLEELKSLGLVECIFPASGRTNRWRHILKEAWGLDGRQRALLAELLLRGPQTEGDLRGRTSRMQDIATLDDLGNLLLTLQQRNFVRRLSPEGQKRGVLWMHLLYTDEERERVAEKFSQRAMEGEGDDSPAESTPTPSAPSPSRAANEERMQTLERRVADLQGQLEDLAQAHDHLATQFRQLLSRIGD